METVVYRYALGKRVRWPSTISVSRMLGVSVGRARVVAERSSSSMCLHHPPFLFLANHPYFSILCSVQ